MFSQTLDLRVNFVKQDKTQISEVAMSHLAVTGSDKKQTNCLLKSLLFHAFLSSWYC